MTDLRVTEVTYYRCPICEREHPTRLEAEACRAQGLVWPPYFAPNDLGRVVPKIGDVVTYGRFGWFDGDPKWVVNPEVGTGQPGGVTVHDTSGECYRFYYRVVAVGMRDEPGNPNAPWFSHRPIVLAATNAMTGKQGHKVVECIDGGDHLTLVPVGNRPAAVRLNMPELSADDRRRLRIKPAVEGWEGLLRVPEPSRTFAHRLA